MKEIRYNVWVVYPGGRQNRLALDVPPRDIQKTMIGAMLADSRIVSMHSERVEMEMDRSYSREQVYALMCHDDHADNYSDAQFAEFKLSIYVCAVCGGKGGIGGGTIPMSPGFQVLGFATCDHCHGSGRCECKTCEAVNDATR